MRSYARWGAGMLGFAMMIHLVPARAAGQQNPHQDGLGNATFALAGDGIITRKLSVYQEPEFLEIRDLVRSATAAFINAEMLFLDYDEPETFPASQSGGTYMRAEPELAEELAWMGFDLVSTANNHSLDYSFGGLRSNTLWLRRAGLVAAGTGDNLAEARAPRYLETQGGRVALVAVSSSFVDFNRAGPQRKDMQGRPGLSPLRVETTYYVPGERFQQLQQLRTELGMRGGGTDDRIQLFGNTFVRGDAYRVTTSVNPEDLEEITAAVRDAKRQANWVIVSSHTHQGGGDVADFLAEFTHAVVDAGADMFVGHGPHVLRGIEIYKGKPIFYSLGDFLFQNETVELQPWENYRSTGLGNDALPGKFYDARIEQGGGSFPARAEIWEAVVAVPVFQAGQLTRVDLHPITLGFGLPRPQRGRPLAAKGELARKIIEDLRDLSAPLGTEISFENGIGVIRVGSGSDSGGS
ncbi:MAG TPA: CapA family protein [Longimicrobiales bacterium]|nr:CapA family protein [Longimicrobiales bacterium]